MDTNLSSACSIVSRVGGREGSCQRGDVERARRERLHLDEPCCGNPRCQLVPSPRRHKTADQVSVTPFTAILILVSGPPLRCECWAFILERPRRPERALAGSVSPLRTMLMKPNIWLIYEWSGQNKAIWPSMCFIGMVPAALRGVVREHPSFRERIWSPLFLGEPSERHLGDPIRPIWGRSRPILARLHPNEAPFRPNMARIQPSLGRL